MSEIEPDHSAIKPYLNPAYWDGRMLGSPETDPIHRINRMGQSKFALRTLEAYLEHRRGPYPLETFGMGEEVNANDHEPGTIFYSHRETLVGPSTFASPTSVEVPERPDDLSFTLLPVEEARADVQQGLSRRHLIADGPLLYRAERSFLIVAPGYRGRHALQPLSEAYLFRQADGRILSLGMQAAIDSSFVVGRTQHTRIGQHDLLARVNAVMLASEGQKREKVSLTEKISQLGLNPLANKH